MSVVFPCRFYVVMSFNEASEDTGFHYFCFFSLLLFVTIGDFVFSFSPVFLCIFHMRESVRIMGVQN